MPKNITKTQLSKILYVYVHTDIKRLLVQSSISSNGSSKLLGALIKNYCKANKIELKSYKDIIKKVNSYHKLENSKKRYLLKIIVAIMHNHKKSVVLDILSKLTKSD